jgi:hypothetical protein
MNKDAFDALSAGQQDALRKAGLQSLAPMLATTQDTAQAALVTICRRGIQLATASPTDRAALRRAVQPVYDELRRDPLTADLIDEIESIRSDEGSRTDSLRCPRTRAGTVPAALEGSWRVDISSADLRAIGAQLEQLERAAGSWTLEIDRGRWVARNLDSGNVHRGTLAAEGDILRRTTRSCVPSSICVPGSVEEYTWSVYLDTLELARIPGRPFVLEAVAKPWTRAR